LEVNNLGFNSDKKGGLEKLYNNSKVPLRLQKGNIGKNLES